MAGSVRAGWVVALMAGCALLAQVACTTTKRVEGFTAPQDTHRVLIIEPDTTVGVLTAGGAYEPRADWTEQARDNITASLKTRIAARAKSPAMLMTSGEVGLDPGVINSLNAEHRKLGADIQQRWKTGVLYKKSSTTPVFKFGEPILAYGQPNGFDYAVLLHAKDSTSTGGRKAFIGAAEVGCVLLDVIFTSTLCMPPSAGHQSAFVSLVDLSSGQIVWHNALSDPFGDLRDATGADEMVKELLGDL